MPDIDLPLQQRTPLPPDAAPRVERAPLIVETWMGVVQRLKDMYSAKAQIIGTGADIQVVPAANADSLERMLQLQDRKLILPIIGVSPTNIEPNDGSYNINAMRRVGAQMYVDDSKDSWFFAKVRPVTMTFQVTMISDDVLTILRMLDRWESTEVWGFKLETTSERIKFNIKVVPDKNIAVPPLAQSTAGSDQFKLTTNLKAETYSGFIWRVPLIREFQVSYNLPKNAATIQEALANPQYGIQVTEQNITSVNLEPQF